MQSYTVDIVIIPILQVCKLRLGLSKLAQGYMLVNVGIWTVNSSLFWGHFKKCTLSLRSLALK